MKGLIIFSHGMEDNEALSTLALLRRAKIDIDSATFETDLRVKTAYGIWIEADKDLNGLDLSSYDFLIIPGGPYVGKVIAKDTQIKSVVQAFEKKQKLIGAICAGPRFLGQLGILNEKVFTAFPGSEIDAPKGRYLEEERAITDGQIITARSAGTVIDFVYHLVSKIKDETAAKQLLESILV